MIRLNFVTFPAPKKSTEKDVVIDVMAESMLEKAEAMIPIEKNIIAH